MGYIRGADRNQSTLMSDCLEDYVAAENPVRVIDAFVDGLDMAALGFKAEPAVEGRPGYDPRDMQKLYILARRRTGRQTKHKDCLTNRRISPFHEFYR